MGKVVSLDNLLASMEARRTDVAPWLGALLGEAGEKFAHLGLPNRRVEAWRYSDLAKALHESVKLEADADAPPEFPGACLAAFENGVLVDKLSSYCAMGAISLRKALAQQDPAVAAHIGKINPQQDHPIVNLNTALMEEGLVLHVPRDVTMATPLHLRFNWSDVETQGDDGRHLRLLVVLEEGASATIFESHDGAPSFATIVSEFRLAANSSLRHIRLENFAAAARQTAVTLAEIGEKATYRGFYLSQGGHFARHEALLKLAGEQSFAEMDGAYLVADKRHCDNTTVVTHAAPNTASKQTFRGVLAGAGRGVYQGCVQVEQAAQKTDAKQLSRALLLSHRAEIVTKPELEIFADDVKCSHGATAGELDANALFFLRARGIPEAQARALLVEAFLAEALDTIGDEVLRAPAAEMVRKWLARHAGEASHVE
ncbi:Fe-S cluster assembly protein SufD [uncultured Rhodoblastus sp.]|uniref:Fe-S cluster assembly protein SufD n=1 Tax=uncultured Rhodoblastus sp. TaxID=543037 RepID=UPI0025FAE0EA|nr:Fe-S cluster assembly protein SufD [uncultured Rhodoblastus sp.]